MKDLVNNRRRIPFKKKLGLLWLVLGENGLLWCSVFGVYYVCSHLAARAFTFMDHLRRTRGLPGLNSRTLNKAIWESWDWGASGDEWSPSEAWKQSVITQVLEKQMPGNASILEIGPGGGRWTGDLIKRSAQFTAVDISEFCVDRCRTKFSAATHATFMVGSGHDLAGVPTASQDGIWSFDVFVHINRAEVAAYLDEFLRVMKPGAVAVLHHGSVGGRHGGWRSDMTGAAMAEMLGTRGFELVSMFKEWQDGAQSHKAGLYDDLITVFRKK